jgi:hypothetical protein
MTASVAMLLLVLSTVHSLMEHRLWQRRGQESIRARA